MVTCIEVKRTLEHHLVPPSTSRPRPIRLRRLRSPVGQQAWVLPTAAFETTFSMLPTKGAEGGTSLGSNANSLIASGAVTASLFLQDPQAATNALELIQEAAPRLGLKIQAAQVEAAEELLSELSVIAKERPDALLVYPDVVLSSYPRPKQLGDFALKANLPTIHAFRFYVDAGGLMSYGATTSEIYTTAAEQVAKILDGARPSDLPLRQATRFELVINNRTAKALELTIPPSLLSQADEVIDSAFR